MDREELKKEFSSRESQRIFLILILVTRCRYRTEKRSIIGNNRLVSLLAVTSDLINHENKRLYFKEFCFVLEYYPTISELDRLIINWGEPIGGVTFIVNIFFHKNGFRINTEFITKLCHLVWSVSSWAIHIINIIGNQKNLDHIKPHYNRALVRMEKHQILDQLVLSDSFIYFSVRTGISIQHFNFVLLECFLESPPQSPVFQLDLPDT